MSDVPIDIGDLDQFEQDVREHGIGVLETSDFFAILELCREQNAKLRLLKFEVCDALDCIP